MCDFIDIDAWEAQSVSGGRTFSRKFDKRYYPLLGDDDEEKEVIRIRGISFLEGGSKLVNSKQSRNNNKCLSTTVSKMQDLCRDPTTGRWRWPVNGVDLVYPGIYLGDESTALCTSILVKMGVTGVLNAAQGNMSGWSYVNTKESYYTRCNIKFLGVPALDVKHYPINEHFQETANFIENILKEKGVVFVHCVAGISRSASLIIAFLIIKKKLSIQESITLIRSKRSIAPNEGFMEQLIELNDFIHGK